MDILNYQLHANAGEQIDFDSSYSSYWHIRYKFQLIFSIVHRNGISCDFCAQQFATIAEKNAHILEHFHKQICQGCNQNLLRIGDSVYILHAELACISKSRTQHDNELDEQNYNELSVIKVDPIDARQYDDDFVKKEEINDAFDQPNAMSLDTIQMHTDETSSKHVMSEIDDSNEQIDSSAFLDEWNIKDGLNEESTGGGSSDESEMVELTSVNKGQAESSKTIDSDKNYRCTFEGCNAMVKRRGLAMHITKVHIKGKRFECDVCKKLFQTGKQYRRHVKTHDTREKFSCDNCGSTNLSEESLRRYHRDPKFKCVECGLIFCKMNQLKNHSSKDPNHQCYNKAKSNRPVRDKTIKQYQCKVDGCNAIINKNNHSYHMATKHLPKFDQYQCDICKKFCAAKSSIYAHILRLHVPLSSKNKCNLCGKAFIYKSLLQLHIQNSHMKEKRFTVNSVNGYFTIIHFINLEIFVLVFSAMNVAKILFERINFKNILRNIRARDHMRWEIISNFRYIAAQLMTSNKYFFFVSVPVWWLLETVSFVVQPRRTHAYTYKGNAIWMPSCGVCS